MSVWKKTQQLEVWHSFSAIYLRMLEKIRWICKLIFTAAAQYIIQKAWIFSIRRRQITSKPQWNAIGPNSTKHVFGNKSERVRLFMGFGGHSFSMVSWLVSRLLYPSPLMKPCGRWWCWLGAQSIVICLLGLTAWPGNPIVRPKAGAIRTSPEHFISPHQLNFSNRPPLQP